MLLKCKRWHIYRIKSLRCFVKLIFERIQKRFDKSYENIHGRFRDFYDMVDRFTEGTNYAHDKLYNDWILYYLADYVKPDY